MAQEREELKARETETKMDYQREKQEIANDLDKIEIEHLQELRVVRDRTVETEVEVRQVNVEIERL